MAEKEETSTSESVFEKPINSVFRKETPIESINSTATVTTLADRQAPARAQVQKEKIPTKSTKPFYYQKVPTFAGELKKEKLRAKLRIILDSIPPPDEEPPCRECKTSACCVAYHVTLTQEEYESGFYDPYAIKISAEAARQLRTIGYALQVDQESDVYMLEGNIGVPCPFLAKDGKCTIYAKRPTVCRTYTCADDPRIDQEVRSGKKPPMYEKGSPLGDSK